MVKRKKQKHAYMREDMKFIRSIKLLLSVSTSCSGVETGVCLNGEALVRDSRVVMESSSIR